MKKLVFLIITLLLTIQLMAQSELKTKSISVFKNGKAFVVKEGEVSTSNNIYTLHKVPNALFGTLWFVGLQSDVVQVTSKQEQVEESVERKASGFRELLYANKGKQLKFITQDDKIYEGVVDEFDLSEDVNNPLLIKLNNKWLSILPGSIKNLEFSEKPEKLVKLNAKTLKPVVKVQFMKGGNQSLSMMYLQNDISWNPTYLLELQSETEGQLKLQAEVANNAEDIVNTNVNFVVGVPNFKFANNPATLTSFVEQMHREIDYYNNNRRVNMLSNAMMSQVMDQSYSEELAEEPVNMEDLSSDVSEDFYYYNLQNISLEKGARAHYPLFNIPIKIKHLYECNLLPSQSETYRNYNNDMDLSFNIKRCNVFHSLEIKNESKNPFTTASVMIVDGKTQRPLSEDLIKYTAIGQTSSIQLTQSPDIRVEEQEKIISTKPEIKKRNGYEYNYHLLTIQSEVVIVNSKKQDIEMAIHKQISGKCKTATVDYDSKQTPSGSINPLDKLKFKLNVKAGQTLKFTYTYEMYVQD